LPGLALASFTKSQMETSMSLLRIFFRTHVLDAPATSVITRATIKRFVSEVLAELPTPEHTQRGAEANCWVACLSLAREGFLKSCQQ